MKGIGLCVFFSHFSPFKKHELLRRNSTTSQLVIQISISTGYKKVLPNHYHLLYFFHLLKYDIQLSDVSFPEGWNIRHFGKWKEIAGFSNQGTD